MIPSMEEKESESTDSEIDDDEELILYTTDIEYAEDEVQNERLEELGLVSWSLWIRSGYGEFPLVAESAWETWFSPNVDTYSPTEGEPVSQLFIEVVNQFFDGGEIDESVEEEMDALDIYLFNVVMEGFFEMEMNEAALIIDWCLSEGE